MSIFRVVMQRVAWSDQLGIMIFEERGRQTYAVQNIDLVFKEVQPYEMIKKPSILLPSMLATPFLKAMADGISDFGIKTDSDEKIKGTLEATRKYLADMRMLALRKSR